MTASWIDTGYRFASFVLVGMLWGCTNAVLKQTTAMHVAGKDERREKGNEGSSGLWDGLKALIGTKV